MSHAPPLSDDRAAIVWPAWLFSTAVHALALTAAALSGAAVFRGAGAPPQQPAGWDLQLVVADELGPPVDEPVELSIEPAAESHIEAFDPPVAMAPVEPAALPDASDRAADALAAQESGPPVEDSSASSASGLAQLLANQRAVEQAAAAASAGDARGHFRVGQLGGRATVRLFGVEGAGSKFVYVFDRSTSMAGAPMHAAQQQLIGSLDALDSVHQFHVIFFNHQISAWSGSDGGGRIAFATEHNKQLAARFVHGITATGGTYRLDALHKALRMAPDVVFFLTDADDTMPADEVAEAIASAGRSGTTIACIEFGRGPASGRANFLTELAQGAGGQYAYVDVQQLGR